MLRTVAAQSTLLAKTARSAAGSNASLSKAELARLYQGLLSRAAAMGPRFGLGPSDAKDAMCDKFLLLVERPDAISRAMSTDPSAFERYIDSVSRNALLDWVRAAARNRGAIARLKLLHPADGCDERPELVAVGSCSCLIAESSNAFMQIDAAKNPRAHALLHRWTEAFAETLDPAVAYDAAATASCGACGREAARKELARLASRIIKFLRKVLILNARLHGAAAMGMLPPPGEVADAATTSDVLGGLSALAETGRGG